MKIQRDFTTVPDNRGDMHCFRTTGSYLRIGIVLIVFCLVADAILIEAYWNLGGWFDRPNDPEPVIFTNVLLLGAIWFVLEYLRKRVLVSPATIVQQGLLFRKSIDVPDVNMIIWVPIEEGNKIHIRSRVSTITIELAIFSWHVQNEIVRYFHETFDASVQEDWLPFEESQIRAQPKAKPNATSLAVLCALFISVWGWLFVASGVAGWGKQWLVIGILLELAAGWYVWQIIRGRES